jgi:hypothetical protein
MLDFPASPTVGQQFTAAGVTWIWDGAKWLPSGLSPTVAPGINDNRVINGDMRIDQRWNGGNETGTSVYTVDRWQYLGTQNNGFYWGQNIGPPATFAPGFPYCLGFSTQAPYAPLATDFFKLLQFIEADMVSDFAWGTANAQSVTLSFWVMATVAGTYSGAVVNAAGTRSYPFSFALAANVWTKVVVSIPGDTAGSWTTSGNGASISVNFDLGSGANFHGPANTWSNGTITAVTGARGLITAIGVLYFTGVKLEIGSVATPYNRQSLAKSMADCQRYYQVFNSAWISSGYTPASVNVNESYTFQIMRAVPTVTFFNVVYNNSSGIQSFSTQSNCVSVAVAATAAGAASANFACTLAAEL